MNSQFQAKQHTVERQVIRSFAGMVLCLLALAGCSSTPEPVAPEPEQQHWSFSETVRSEQGMVTLFDPADLAHHRGDPEDWYRYGFAIANDLEVGRFTAVMTDRPGHYSVRITSGPLSAEEKRVAGPQAVQRLRVINQNLLLSGGEAWPSINNQAPARMFGKAWIGVGNGDYRVIITVLDRHLGARHDVVFQLLPVDDMLSVKYAPGIPFLVPGQPPAVAALNAAGLSYRESCGSVPSTALWSPLTSTTLPLPGSQVSIDLSSELYSKGLALQSANKPADVPIVVARNPVAGALGLFIQPAQWDPAKVATNGEIPVNTRVLCAVTIKGVEPGLEGFALQIEPLPAAEDPLPASTVRELTTQFENWVRMSSDPAWLYKSQQIKHTRNKRALMLGIIDYLALYPKHSESLLLESNSGLAVRLLDHMSNNGMGAGR